MVIYVKMPAGKTIPLSVQSTDSVEKIKQRIQDREGIPSDQQLLTYSEIELEDRDKDFVTTKLR